MNSPLARTAGAPAEPVFTRDASLAENTRVSQRRTTIQQTAFKRSSELFESARFSVWSLSLSIRGLIGFFPLSPVWSSPRCWNMNQSAGAAQHSRRYSSDKVRRGSGCRWPLPVWSCLHDSFGLNFQETLVYRENKVDCCEEPKPKHVEEVMSHLTDI